MLRIALGVAKRRMERAMAVSVNVGSPRALRPRCIIEITKAAITMMKSATIAARVLRSKVTSHVHRVHVVHAGASAAQADEEIDRMGTARRALDAHVR